MAFAFGNFDFHMAARLLAGKGQVEQLGEELKKMSIGKPMLVTDSGLVKTPLFAKVVGILADAGIKAVQFTEVEPNPTIEMINTGVDLYKKEACDGLIGLGGGSSLDTAKGIGVVITNPGSIKEYCGPFKVKNWPAPVVAIPTTTGTGSEASWHISVKDKANNFKLSVRSNLVTPALSIIDPDMVATLPAPIAAFTGMDALTHLFESYTSTNSSVIMDLFALEGLKYLGNSFRIFHANTANSDAAMEMMYAAMLGGIVISHARTGAVHALARPVGAHYDVAHGLACGILMPYVMEYNRPAEPEKFANLALCLGENIEGLSRKEAALRAVDAVKDLIKDLGMPAKLGEVGVDRSKMKALAQDALQTGSTGFNARKVDEKALLEILDRAI